MTDEQFIKQAKELIIDKEWDSVSHKDCDTPENWGFNVKMIWYGYNDVTDSYIATFEFESKTVDYVRYQVACSASTDEVDAFVVNRYSAY